MMIWYCSFLERIPIAEGERSVIYANSKKHHAVAFSCNSLRLFGLPIVSAVEAR